MDEAKRFIRYIIPGLVTLPQLITFVYFYKPDFFKVFIDKESDNFGIAILTFFATGILGYIFSSVYYVVHWSFAFKWTKLDYNKIVTDPENAILFKDYKTHNLRQYEAGATMSVCWKMLCNNKYDELDVVERTFGNILHSLGTTVMILFTGMIIESVFLIKKFGLFNWDSGLFIIMNLVVICFLVVNYLRVASMLQLLWEQSFTKLRKLTKRRSDQKKSNRIIK